MSGIRTAMPAAGGSLRGHGTTKRRSLLAPWRPCDALTAFLLAFMVVSTQPASASMWEAGRGDSERVPMSLHQEVYITTETTLTFDGREVVVQGTARCRWPYGFLCTVGEPPARYRQLPMLGCWPRWFATRLEDGGAILVSTPLGLQNRTNVERRDLMPTAADLYFLRRAAEQTPPQVVWLDDAEHPTHGLLYYARSATNEPGSRLTALRHEVVSIRKTTMAREARWPVSDPELVVPAMKGGDAGRPIVGLGGYVGLLLPTSHGLPLNPEGDDLWKPPPAPASLFDMRWNVERWLLLDRTMHAGLALSEPGWGDGAPVLVALELPEPSWWTSDDFTRDDAATPGSVTLIPWSADAEDNLPELGPKWPYAKGWMLRPNWMIVQRSGDMTLVPMRVQFP